jgi:predicted permease
VPNNTVDSRILTSNAHQFHLVARLRPAVTYEQAASIMDALGGQIDEAYPDPRGAGTWSATALPLDEYRVGSSVRISVMLLFAGAGLVLLTACVNVAGLVLALSEARRREFGTRLALGSGRRRLIRQLLTESLVLSAAGGVLGIAIAVAGVKYFNSLGAATRLEMSGLERTAFNSISIDSAALAVCLLVVCVAPLLVGLWPAKRSSRISLVGVLKGGGSGRKPHRGLARSALVTIQVALAFTLLVGSSLLVTTMRRLHATDLGFRSEGLLTVRVALPASRYDSEARWPFFSQLVERVEALPEIQAASFVDCVPLADGCRGTSRVHARDGVGVDSNAEPIVGVTMVSPGFFRSLDIPISRGRTFTDLDREDAPRVAMISQDAAARFWPGEEAVGRTFSIRGFEGATVVGVVADVRHEAIEDSPGPNLYVPAMQVNRPEGFLVARVSGGSAAYISAIREVVRNLDPNLPIFDVRTMTDRVADATWRTRFSGLVISLFAAMTFALSAIGIYGAFCHSVETRTRGIGMRMALGATRARVLKGVLGRAAALVAAGIIPGILLASVSTRFMESLLFETDPHDPATFGVVSVAFLAVALLASFFPAKKASGVDPAAVLRNE